MKVYQVVGVYRSREMETFGIYSTKEKAEARIPIEIAAYTDVNGICDWAFHVEEHEVK